MTSRTPSFQNNLGYDADLFRTTNVLGNAQTSTQVRLSTSGDAYQPGVVTLATDLYAPKITATKTVDLATANLGDALTYTVAIQNTGQDAAAGTTFADVLPPGTAFVPGSVRLNGAPVSDAAGDDLGEFAGGRVVVRLGAGATAGAGGALAPGASATVSFQATVAAAGLPLGADDREHRGPRVPRRDDRRPEHGDDRSGDHQRERARSGDRQVARAGPGARAADAPTRSPSATWATGRRPGR